MSGLVARSACVVRIVAQRDERTRAFKSMRRTVRAVARSSSSRDAAMTSLSFGAPTNEARHAVGRVAPRTESRSEVVQPLP
jgi:hypothetical protein